MCNIMHADGAGTKSSLAYLYWKETGDLSVWKVRASPQANFTCARRAKRGAARRASPWTPSS